MQWNAEPGLESDYGDCLDQLQIVDDAQPFDQEIGALDLTPPDGTLSVTDEDNPLLEENVEAHEAETGAKPNSAEVEYTEAELQLLAMVDEAEGRRRGQFYSNPSDTCDACGCNLAERAFFVDGRWRGQIMFASLCAECFFKKGEGVGWGKGQLYQREPDGEWLLAAGFPPTENQ